MTQPLARCAATRMRDAARRQSHHIAQARCSQREIKIFKVEKKVFVKAAQIAKRAPAREHETAADQFKIFQCAIVSGVAVAAQFITR